MHEATQPTALFIDPETLERLLEHGQADLSGSHLTLITSNAVLDCRTETALRFGAEVSGGGDAHNLSGRVKTLEEVALLGGDYSSGSVVLGEHAYEVQEGLLALPKRTA